MGALDRERRCEHVQARCVPRQETSQKGLIEAVALAKRILEDAGIGGDRLEMYNMSAAMGPRFAEVAREMTERIRKLGPSPINRQGQSAEGRA